MEQQPFGAFDSPGESQVVTGVIQLIGWELHGAGSPCRLEFSVGDQPVEAHVERVNRPDVASRYPQFTAQHESAGFLATINTAPFLDGRQLFSCSAAVNGAPTVFAKRWFDVRNGPEHQFFRRAYAVVTPERRRRKLESLLPLLQCKSCRGQLEIQSKEQLRCTVCRTTVPLLDGVPVMVRGEPEYPVVAAKLASPASNNPLPPEVTRLLERTLSAGGIALDVGSGRRVFGADGYIQLEISAYPFTDVVSQDVRLPFKDESFDLVLSLAVTEHVKQPWILAEEIKRVTTRGGTIHVDSAFMQPLHGYPSHYFNMTRFALREIFQGIEIGSLKPAPYQHPWFSISWILDRLLIDLPQDQREMLGRMTVELFLDELRKFCNGQPNQLAAVQLSEAKIEELAAGFTLIGTRP